MILYARLSNEDIVAAITYWIENMSDHTVNRAYTVKGFKDSPFTGGRPIEVAEAVVELSE